MSRDEVKKLFDQAYGYMALGEFASATGCFEQVIKHSGDPNASRIAEQRIRWYCVPLDSILKKMDELKIPIDVHEELAQLFGKDSQYIEAEQQSIIQVVELELAKLPSVIHVGEKVWAKLELINNQLEYLALDILNAATPIDLSTWLINQFGNNKSPDDYPDYITLGVVEAGLQEYPIILIEKKHAIAKAMLAIQLDSLENKIRKTGRPIPVKLLVEALFPDETLEFYSRMVPFFVRQLDSRFIEVSQGIVFLNDLLGFNTASFEEVFLLSRLPISTDELICSCLFAGQVPQQLTQRFHSVVEIQLAQNPNLHQIERSYWITKKMERELSAQVEKYLLEIGIPQGSRTILDNVFPMDQEVYASRDLLLSLINVVLNDSQNVIWVESQIWIHSMIFNSIADESYRLMLISPKPMTTVELLRTKPDFIKEILTPSLIQRFERFLSRNSKFIQESSYPSSLWRVNDPKKEHNQVVLQTLKQVHKLLAQEEIASILVTQYGISSPVFELASDDRFKSFSLNRWGLKEWVLINDLAYDYLLTSRQALHEIVIIGLISKHNHIKQEDVIFTPLEDPRFSQDSLNRWFCRHSLSSADLEKLHDELIKYGGSGRKIDLLVQQVLHKEADATDAEIILNADERFIHLDNLWFARQAAFYALIPEDVEKIYNTLAQQADTHSAISLKELVHQSIGHDGRLTDADTWLRNDTRFIEVHDDFWGLSSSQEPDFDRSGIGGIAVHSPGGSQILVGTDKEAEKDELTPRKPRIKKGEGTQEPGKKVYITLTHLDILHGNLRVAGMLKHWIPEGAKNVHFQDDEEYEFIAYIDETGSIINIREWLEKRGLTYGDKISIQPGSQSDELFIRPYGKRDERVYQEALDHQEIEKLIDEARRVNKDFHDLMIEVMESFDYPLHREDIYQLVNYQRTANRNTISEILSLPDCPFEELRYFIPVGAGNWKFDRKRKEAYDMKMQELLIQNTVLQSELISLQEQIVSQHGSSEEIEVLSSKNQQLQTENAELQVKLKQVDDEKRKLEQGNSELHSEVNTLNGQVRILRIDIEESQTALHQIQALGDHELAQLRGRINSLTIELDSLRAQSVENQEKANNDISKAQEQLSNQKIEIERQSNQVITLEAELVTANSEKDKIQNEIDQLKSENAVRASNLEADLAAAQINKESLQREVDQLKIDSTAKASKQETVIAAAKSKIESLQQEIERVKQESVSRNSQMEAELAIAHTKMEQAREIAKNPAPLTFKQAMQSLYNSLFHRKSKS